MAKQTMPSGSEALAGEIKRDYARVRPLIEARLREFEAAWRDYSDEKLFAELAFCLFTPQSKAKNCWASVCALAEGGLLLCGEPKRISGAMSGVRFHNNKGRYVVEAQRLFTSGGRLRVRKALEGLGGPRAMRDWLVSNVLGMSYKEASHFLRNLGMGSDLAILDRHILRNMRALGYIGELPRAVPAKRYLELEAAFLRMARDLGMPPDHLDMLLWYREAGEVFK